MPRLLPIKLVLAAALLLAAVPSAQAYSLFSSPKLRTYTYSSSAKEYRTEVKLAVRAWNRSGARVRWVQSRRPRVRIKVDRRIGTAGLANFTYGGGQGFRGTIRLLPNLGKNKHAPQQGRSLATAIMVHEMGHIMGLNHEDRRCAVMNSLLWQACKDNAASWQYRCRYFERDDLRGLLKRFGGRRRKLGPVYCNAEPQPGVPSGFSATSGPDGVKVAFVAPTSPAGTSVRVMRRRDTCPTGLEDGKAEPAAFEEVKPGEAKSVPDKTIYAAGRYCYAAFAIGKLGRPGKAATTWLDYAGSSGFEEPSDPYAYFSAEDRGARQFAFDGSQSGDPDGQIVSWQWDFGDGTGGSGQLAGHTYAADGDYTVSLTVTDNSGKTATYTEPVYVLSAAG